ncbi:hypothetical protein PTH_1957 [Pelotomaculum thermopropionicum SI]|uniref:Sporulation protein YtxC n=1 Tax=Pelotomaculum thermopropionicum (strain DSM 13744 / JCM 10971 / SI) TaxID=370438 RepID=A5D0U8_PELTS|nr:hypothetical protein PTH_1957 [Pelotomaculum thermopropionicum SI]
MAQIISIGATQHIGLLKARLGREVGLFEEEGLKVFIEEKPAGEFTFLSCHITNYGKRCYSEEEIRPAFIHYIADAISEVILSHWEDELLKGIIKEHYCYFGQEDKNLIFNYALRHISRDDGEPAGAVHRMARKNMILRKVQEFLGHSNRIIIDGFIRFRLREYLGQLRQAADKAVDELLMEKEYGEFIQLLKYFVEVQQSCVDLVHVLIRPSGSFWLFNEKMQPVGSESLEGFSVSLDGGEINYEDVLVSALIAIAPGKIILHNADANRPVALDTIKKVFTGRFEECPGCGLCITEAGFVDKCMADQYNTSVGILQTGDEKEE